MRSNASSSSSKQAIPAIQPQAPLPMYQLRQYTTGDAYAISNPSSTLLRSTFVPTLPQRPIYELTTDIASGTSATTILWKFDLASNSVNEVARIAWANTGSKTVIEMEGLRIPANEFLTKPKWRLGVAHATHSFTSQMEEYKWVPQPTLFDSDSCVWHCVQPISRGPAAGPSTILAVYRPSTSSSVQQTQPGLTSLQHHKSHHALLRTGWRSSMSLESIHSTSSVGRQSLFGHAASSSGHGSQRIPASLEVYPEVDEKPHLRDILVLTAILVATGKDEWKSLPHSWDHQLTTPELVLARLTETYGPSHPSS